MVSISNKKIKVITLITELDVFFQTNTLLFFLYVLGFVTFSYYNILTANQETHFAYLANSFLHGHLYLGKESIWLHQDASYYNGYAYWHQGFFPAIVLLPFIFLDINFAQSITQFFLNVCNLLLLYSIALKITKNNNTSLWLSFAYIFGTVYIAAGAITWSWYFAQIIATFLLLASLHEFYTKKKFWKIGIYISFAVMTRVNLLIATVFFLLTILFDKKKINKPKELLLFLLPILISLIIIGIYNFLRFGSLIEFGYKYNIPQIYQVKNMLHTYGVWNIVYFPTNLYYLFFKSPESVLISGTNYLTFPYIKSSIWGMSIILTSPIFLWCFKTNIKEKTVQYASITTILLLIFILGFFGIGARQYGYRYALDFMPFLYIILCYACKNHFGTFQKTIITISFFYNILLFPSAFSAPLQ